MNIFLTKKSFLIPLLILTLCANTALTAYAGEPAVQSDPFSKESADEDLSADTPDSGSDDENTSKDDTDDASAETPPADKPASDISSEEEPSADDSSANDSSADDSSADDPATEETSSDSIHTEEADILPADESEKDLIPASVEGETTYITLSAAGDCTLGIDSRYSHNFNTYYRKKGDNYFFKKVRSIFAKDDITIVNFEGTLTTSSKRAKKTFTFKGPKKYASILKKGSVEVVNLANNHSKDYGKVSLSDTQKTMNQNNIGYCRNTVINYQTVNGVKTAFLGFNALNKITKSQIETGISKAKKNNAEIIVVSFHWGVERKYYPNTKQKTLGHYAIDCGASLVLGHHPHVLQGIEKYNGRYIVYSLGNFCFGGNSNPKDKDTMIFQQTFSIKGGKLQPDNNAKIIPCSLSSHKNNNDFQPRVLSGKEKKRLIKKMNTLSKKLKVSIDSNGNIK